MSPNAPAVFPYLQAYKVISNLHQYTSIFALQNYPSR